MRHRVSLGDTGSGCQQQARGNYAAAGSRLNPTFEGVNLAKFGPRCVGVPTQQLPLGSNETQLKLFLPSTKQTLLNAFFSARDQWTNNPQSPEPTGPAPFFEGGVHAPDQSAAGRV